MRILTKNQSVELDKISIENYSVGQSVLMASAADSIVSGVEKYSLLVNNKPRILILCGKGNNGGDAICSAIILFKKKYDVHVHFIIEKNDIRGPSARYHDEYVDLSGSVSYGFEFIQYDGFDLLIDGIIGIGFRDNLKENLIPWINWINQSDMYIISVDIPSGLNANNGLASPIAVKANITITFGYSKIGLYLADGKDYAGEIKVADIGFPKAALDGIDEIACKLFKPREVEEILVKVPSNTYKQDRGKVLIIAGSIGMTGAAILSTYGALRSGAGISITVCPSSLSNIYEKYILEGMTISCEDDGKGYLSMHNYDNIMEKVEWADSLVIGPGLGLNEETIKLVTELINTINKPIVLDADGLSCFNQIIGSLDNLVITPHLGEFSKILNMDRKKIICDFIHTVEGFMNTYTGVALIKHVPSCVAYGNQLSLNSTGNPGLATAGSGDVLSGMIASFISQKMNNYDACRLSSYLHGKAADNLIKNRGYRGLIASDLPLEVASVIGEYENI
jgi:NAD(P)H-hydrate epimerase